MTSAIWRVSGRLNIPLYPELTEKQANEEGNLRSICIFDLLHERSLGMNARKVNVWHISGWERDTRAIQNRMAKWIHGWRKFLHGCSQTDAWMRKIFERMQLNGWTADKKFWADEVEQINCWREYFWMDDRLKKYLFLNGCGRLARRSKYIIILS